MRAESVRSTRHALNAKPAPPKRRKGVRRALDFSGGAPAVAPLPPPSPVFFVPAYKMVAHYQLSAWFYVYKGEENGPFDTKEAAVLARRAAAAACGAAGAGAPCEPAFEPAWKEIPFSCSLLLAEEEKEEEWAGGDAWSVGLCTPGPFRARAWESASKGDGDGDAALITALAPWLSPGDV